MLKMSSSHTDSRSETFAPRINCIIDDALLETMPDIDQMLLQFIDFINLLDLARPAAAFLPYFCSQSGFSICRSYERMYSLSFFDSLCTYNTCILACSLQK